MAVAKLRRITELFEQGELVKVADGDDGGQPLFVWVQKPNSFEHDEAIKDGQYARGLRMQAFDRDEKEQAALNAVIEAFSDHELVEFAIDRAAPRMMQEANTEVRTREDWQERLAVLDRQALGATSDSEKKALEELNAEFAAEVRRVYEKLAAQARTDLMGQTREEREREWREAYRDQLGMQEFFRGKTKTEVFYALRDVEVEFVDGEWRPVPGADKPRLLQDREDVVKLPDELLNLVLEALNRQMTVEEAGNLDAPSDSSEPSERPAKQEDSTRSGRAATSRKPAGTSSTRPRRR